MTHVMKKKWNSPFFIVSLMIWGIIATISYIFLSFSFYSFYSDLEHQLDRKHKILIISAQGYPAEQQESFHNCKAINNLGSNCYIFEYGLFWENNTYNSYARAIQRVLNHLIKPDFVYYNTPKLVFDDSNYIKYGILDIARKESVDFLANNTISKQFTDWMEGYNGFIVYGDNHKWSDSFIKAAREQNNRITTNYLLDYYPSIFKTAFTKQKRKRLFFHGGNWDKLRGSEHYKKIYKLLDKKDYFEVYGLDHNWEFLNNSYKGFIDTDTTSLIDKIRDLGIAMVFHSNYHLENGIPSKRIFEVAAAGAVIISDKNPFIVREFGDCIYYIDPLEEPTKVVKDIDNIVKLMQSNPELANEKAACAHNIFLNKFTLEKQWERIFKMHEINSSSKNR